MAHSADITSQGWARANSGQPLTVDAALAHPVLREATVVAGAGGLGRQVEGVSVLDIADLDALAPHQIVLSSAYPLAGTSLRRLIERLDAAGTSALGLKTHGFWHDEPPELVAAANEAQLPLLSLPEGRFADLVTPLLEEIAERQAERLRRAAGLHHALTEASLRQEGLPAITELLGQTLGLPVAVLGEDGNMLASNAPGEGWDDASLVEFALNSSGVGATQIGGHPCSVAPITAGNSRYGTLVALGSTAEDPFARAAMALTTVVSGIELLRERQVAAVHRKYQRELLDDLAEGRLSEAEARERAQRIGWPMHSPYVVLAAVRRPEPAHGLNTLRSESAMSEDELLALSRAVLAGRADARPFWRAPGLGVVVHLGREEDPRAVAAGLQARLAGTPRVPYAKDALVVGVSRPTLEVVRFAEAFREAALAALLSSRLLRGDGRIEHFDDLGAARLLALAKDQTPLLAAARAALRGVDDDSRASRELLETLAVLLAGNLRLTYAADELFFHYNTIRHRFARLRELLDQRLTEPEGRLLLWLAVTTLRIADVDQRLFSGRQLPTPAV